MNIKTYRPIFVLIVIISFLFIFHKIIFFVNKTNTDSFYYSIETLYGIFLSLSILLLILLLKVEKKNFDQVGMTFMLATSVKMLICYAFLRPILTHKTEINFFEKKNFLITFLLFLTVETVLTIRMLNKKQ